MSPIRLLKGQSVLLGVAATLWQLVLLREFMSIFYGNELIIGVLLAGWLSFVGLGCWLGDQQIFKRWSIASLALSFIITLWIVFVGIKYIRVLAQVPMGEFISLPRMLLVALPSLGIPCFLLGVWFSRLAVSLAQLGAHKPSTIVYIYESLGAVLAGLSFTFILVKWLGNFFTLIALSLLILHGLAQKRKNAHLIILAVILTGWALLAGKSCERYLSRQFWQSLAPGVQLQTHRITRYGDWAVLNWSGEMGLYCNGIKQTSLPDPIGNQLLAAVALTQHPHPQKVLLIGGGMGGLIQELSAGPGIEVTYLEMDADAFQMAKEFVPSLATAKTIFQDGRRYLLQSQEHYDIIIVHAGRPSTALNNRFYTREFHQLASQRLTPTGVFALCGIPSGENVVGSELLHLNSALYQDLSTVFRHLLVIPGDAAHYFAANQSDILCMDPDSLIHRYRSLDRQDRYFHPHMFASLFMPERRTQFTQSLQQVQISNRDERPVSYLLDLLIWLKQVSGLSALGTTLRPPPILPLGFSVCLLIVLGVSIKKRSAATCQMIMFLSGLTSISLNLIFLLMLQSLYGYVYEGLGLAMAAYMAGMAITAAAVHKGHPSSSHALPVLLLGTMLFLILLMPAFRFFMNHSSLTLFFLVIIGGGALNGAVFPFLNALYLQHHAIAYGRIYAMDVLGAAVGSLMINSYAVPILGFSATLHWLAGFCALAWLGAQFSPGGDHL